MPERPVDIYVLAEEVNGVFVRYSDTVYTELLQAQVDAFTAEGNWIVLKYGRPVTYRGQL